MKKHPVDVSIAKRRMKKVQCTFDSVADMKKVQCTFNSEAENIKNCVAT